jgi:hypothetical protein
MRAALPTELAEQIRAKRAQALVLRAQLLRKVAERGLPPCHLGLAEIQSVVPAVEVTFSEGRHCGATSVVGRGT